MSDWDLMMPGMGLTAIGIAGVTISYSGIAHTFIDGMHALTGLTLFIGLIILSVGILNGGVSTSNRAKATTLVILSIVFSFATYGFTLSTSTTLVTFTGILLAISMPSIVIAYMAMKMPKYLKPVGAIFGMAAAAGIISFVVFGLSGPDPYLIESPVEEATVAEPAVDLPVYTILMLEGSDMQGNPDYEPDAAQVPHGYLIEWVNEDIVLHTATSSEDFGATFDSGIVDAGQTYSMPSDELEVGTYEYFCQVHPWMTSTLEILEAEEPVQEPQIIP